jgi:adenylate cyclase
VAQQRVERRLAAILAADAAGYSRLTGADEEGTLERLRTLRGELIDPAVNEHRGRIVKTTGDGFLVEFASVVDAVRCAITVQRGMARRNTEVSVEKRILFRIGINLGDVVAEGDDLLGDGVNVAARLEGIAEPGGICLSRAAYDQARGKIDLAVKDLGEQRLKNIAEPVQVYSVSLNGKASVSFGDGVQGAVPSASSSGVSGTYRRGAGIAGAVAVLVAIAVGTMWFATRSGPPQQAPRLSIVVLPFANLSGDPAQDYLADIITEELTTGLSRISGTFVIARSTAFTYKGKPVDVKQVGKDLVVRYVLEGSEHGGCCSR